MKKKIIALLMVMTSMLFITGVKADFKTGDEISFSSHKNTAESSYAPIKFEITGGYVGTCSENQEESSPSGQAKIKEKVAITSDAAKAIYYFAIVKDWQRGLGQSISSSEGKLGWNLEKLGWYYGGNALHEAFVSEAKDILNNDQGWKTVNVPSRFEIYFAAPNDDSQEFVFWRLAPFEASKKYATDSPKGKNNSAVKVGDEIKYEIEFKNGEGTLTITDTLSKGLEYVADSAKIGNNAVNPIITKNNDGTTKLVWTTTEATNKLTYNAKVTKDAVNWVNNDASIKVGNNADYKLTKLTNPVPKKDYAGDTKAGANGEYVKKNDVITYSIKYSNVKKNKITVIITDNLSKGLEYEKGSAKINGESIEPSTITKDENGTILIWVKEIKPGENEELKYSAKVTGEKMLVENNASIQYDSDPSIKLNELKNPLKPEPEVVKVPNTLAGIPLYILIFGLGLLTISFIIYEYIKKNKK